MSNSQPDVEIRNWNDKYVGSMQFTHDEKGRHASLTITARILSEWDMLVVIQQALEHTYVNGKREPLEYIAFEGCNFIPSTFDRDYFVDRLKPKHERLAFKEIRFTGGNGSMDLFRVFVRAVAEDDHFNITAPTDANDPDYLKSLVSIDLSGNALTQENLNQLRILTSQQNNPSNTLWIPCLKLKNCSLTDNDANEIAGLVKEGKICQMELNGNNITAENMGKSAVQLRYNSKARIGMGFFERESKVTHDFNLPPRTHEVEYAEGRSVNIPVRGAALDLTGIDITDEIANPQTNPDYDQFRLFLAISNPTEIIYRDRPNSLENLERLFGPGGLNYSASVRKIDASYTTPQATRPTPGLSFITAMATEFFPNTEELVLDNSNFAATQTAAGRYLGYDFCSLVSAPNLKTLSLRECRLSDEDIIDSSDKLHLTAKKAGKNLRWLDLSSNPITDACAQPLLEWVKDSNITSIDLDGTLLTTSKLVIYQAAKDNEERAKAGAATAGAEGSIRLQGQEVDVAALRSKLQKNKIIITSGGQPLPGQSTSKQGGQR